MPPAAPTKEQKADSIKVFLRVRPLMGRELAESHACKNLVCDPNDDNIVRVRDPRLGTDSNAVEKKFAFHQVFPPQATQEQVYNAFAKDAVDDALNGYHGVMFVYGQTGSGKTFTMSNEEPGKEGMLQRSMRAVWQKINADRDYEYVCSVSYVQLYNEMLTDMLEGNSEMNSVRLSGVADRRNDVMLVNDTTNQPIAKDVTSYEETISMFRQGVARRVSASTEMNSVSSRSHTVFTLYIKKQARTEAAASGGGNLPTSLEGRLVICDLAGSERVKKTDAKGQQLNEANHINGSLLVLGRVVAALTDAKASQHVPYRESKLTRLLQYSLSGWGKTRLVVNVSPSDDNTDETLGAIAFGQRAIQIKQAAEKHATLDYKALYLELQRQTDMSASIAMKDLITAANAEKQAALAEYADRVKMLEAEIELLNSDIAKKDSLIAELSQGGGSAGSAATQGTAAPVAVTPQRQQSFSTPGGDGNSFALSPNGSSIVEGSTLQIFVTKMKQQLTSRDERLAEVTRENLEIKQKLAQSEQNLLTIASKLRTHMAVSQSERAFYEKTITELSAKADSGKGVEYLNPNGAQDDDEEDRNAGSNFSASSPTLDEASPSLEQENKNLLAALRVLHARLNESQAYNRTARRAIRMLASDLEAAQRASGAASH